MEETQKNSQSPSFWSSMQDPVRNQPRTTQKDLVNDLKVAGTIVTKKTISNTLCRNGQKSCSARKVPLLKKANVQDLLKFANDHLNDSEENWVKVLWTDDPNRDLWHQLNRVWRRRNAPRTPSPP
uniref:Transposase Tc1-like domain-containing protein n=1 Tax=Esox lucius TaxID=8010 RepID=A0AAY5L275_ESOLU